MNEHLVDEVIARYPAEFGLRAWPGRRFCILRQASFWDTGERDGKPHHDAGPMLYIYAFIDGKWQAWTKATPFELDLYIVR